jgi:hypothetical protein
MFYNVSIYYLIFWIYVIFDEKIEKIKNKGKDSNELVSKNQGLK